MALTVTKNNVTLMKDPQVPNVYSQTTAVLNDMQNGRTPLHCAASSGDVSTAKLLLEAGADVMATAKVGSCVSIGRYLNDIGYRHYGKHSICFTKSKFVNM